MKSIISEQITEIEVKKSRFICYIQNVNSIDEAKLYINKIKLAHPSANHHCSAYRVGIVERANDDGEPSLTAGMPILNVLKHNELADVCAVVVRYFGGIKLGAGGLVRAYTDSVVQGLNEAKLANLVAGFRFEMKGNYKHIDKINYICKKIGIDDLKISYGQNVIFSGVATGQQFELLKNQVNNYDHLIKFDNIEKVSVVCE